MLTKSIADDRITQLDCQAEQLEAYVYTKLCHSYVVLHNMEGPEVCTYVCRKHMISLCSVPLWMYTWVHNAKYYTSWHDIIAQYWSPVLTVMWSGVVMTTVRGCCRVWGGASYQPGTKGTQTSSPPCWTTVAVRQCRQSHHLGEPSARDNDVSCWLMGKRIKTLSCINPCTKTIQYLNPQLIIHQIYTLSRVIWIRHKV